MFRCFGSNNGLQSAHGAWTRIRMYPAVFLGLLFCLEYSMKNTQNYYHPRGVCTWTTSVTRVIYEHLRHECCIISSHASVRNNKRSYISSGGMQTLYLTKLMTLFLCSFTALARYSGWKGMFSDDVLNNPSVKGWSQSSPIVSCVYFSSPAPSKALLSLDPDNLYLHCFSQLAAGYLKEKNIFRRNLPTGTIANDTFRFVCFPVHFNRALDVMNQAVTSPGGFLQPGAKENIAYLTSTERRCSNV